MKEIKIKRLNKDFTVQVRVKLTKQFLLRIWLGKQLMRLAAVVMGCSIEYKNVD